MDALSEEELGKIVAELVSLSHKMADAARTGEWQVVVEFEKERSLILKRLSTVFDPSGCPDNLIELWRQAILSIIESDKEVTLLAETEKRQLAEGLSEIGSSRKAVNSYLDNLSP